MRKKLLIGILSLGLLFSLASCMNSNISIINNETSSNYTDVANQSGNGNLIDDGEVAKLEANYKKTKAEITTTNETKTNSIEDTVAEIYESVVSITAKSVSATSAGSGVLFSYDTDLGLSYIVTCFHVIEDATSFSVTISDYNDDEVNLNAGTYEAKLVGGYEDNDLAVLSIEKTGLSYAKIFEDSDKLRLGSDVICIGNPLGTLPGSVSKGVVSFVNRELAKDNYQTIEVIQTDVAINSGNSGGGLFNSSGALIGIVNAKYASSSIEGLGFAIPSNSVKNAIESILLTAEYDVNNKVWNTGYVVGDFEFGFTISIGSTSTGSGFFRQYNYVLYVSSVATKDAYSGTNLKTNTVISSITVNYKDTSKNSVTYVVPATISATSNIEATKFLYDANLAIGDTVTFTYSDNSTVSFDIVQFKYSI